eukprot:5229935-Prymnesium_polylepis.2
MNTSDEYHMHILRSAMHTRAAREATHALLRTRCAAGHIPAALRCTHTSVRHSTVLALCVLPWCDRGVATCCLLLRSVAATPCMSPYDDKKSDCCALWI